MGNPNKLPDPLARARHTDPDTSHGAADSINQEKGKLETTMEYISSLVSEFPNRSMGEIVDIHCLRTEEGASAYGRLTTVFHHCEEAGLIRTNGKVRDERTRKMRYVYVPVPPEERSAARAAAQAEAGAKKKSRSVKEPAQKKKA